MKEEWKVVKVKDICDKASSNVAQKKLGNHNGEFPIFGASGFIKNVDFYHHDKPYVGIIKDGSGVGRVNLYPAFSSVLGTLQYIFPKEGFDLRFVLYALQSFNISKYSIGAAIPHIYFRDYGEHEIAVPNIHEQQRIVGILDAAFEKIDALKANAEKNLENAKALFQQVLAKELEPKEGWEEKKLNDIYNFIDYRGATPNKVLGGIPLVTAKNVRMGYLDYSIKDYISQEEYASRQSRGISHKGDILFTTEAPLGNVALADLEVFSAGQRVITFQQYKRDNSICNEFFLYYFMSPAFQKTIKELATGLTAQGIKAKILKGILIHKPLYSEQRIIASTLDALSAKCRHLETLAQKTITECDALKQSILRQAFNGEL